jgi:hypothetical protein
MLETEPQPLSRSSLHLFQRTIEIVLVTARFGGKRPRFSAKARIVREPCALVGRECRLRHHESEYQRHEIVQIARLKP